LLLQGKENINILNIIKVYKNNLLVMARNKSTPKKKSSKNGWTKPTAPIKKKGISKSKETMKKKGQSGPWSKQKKTLPPRLIKIIAKQIFFRNCCTS
jgi:hypothetical protein